MALARHLGRVARSGNSVVIVADTGGDLAGYVELTGGSFRRSRATAHLVIGLIPSWAVRPFLPLGTTRSCGYWLGGAAGAPGRGPPGWTAIP